jgi:N-methylhydantoinase A
MLSSGGLTTLEQAKAFPVKLLESGLAAGAVAAAHLADLACEDKVIAFATAICPPGTRIRSTFSAGN